MTATQVIQRITSKFFKRFYNEDALITSHTHDFIYDPDFKLAYERGLKASGGMDLHNRWRIHVALWAAKQCLRLDGDFLECGVNYGMTSSAIMTYLDWKTIDKEFFLCDSFSGTKTGSKAQLDSGFFNCSYERARDNFAEWENAHVIKGWLPESLPPERHFAFVHIDLNDAKSEVETFKRLLPSLQRGAVVLLDDYAYTGFESSYEEWNRHGLNILAIPTGQGMIMV